MLTKHQKEIEALLKDDFAPVLTRNEIKAASAPLHNLIFNPSERFKSVLKNAGDGFQLHVRKMAVILNFFSPRKSFTNQLNWSNFKIYMVKGWSVIKVPVLYHSQEDNSAFYTYDDVISELKN